MVSFAKLRKVLYDDRMKVIARSVVRQTPVHVSPSLSLCNSSKVGYDIQIDTKWHKCS